MSGNFRPGFAAASACAIGLAAAFAVTAAAAQQITMKISHPLPPNTVTDVWAKEVKAGLEKRAPGRFAVEIYPATQLGTIPSMIEGTQLGTIEMLEASPEYLSGIDGRFSIIPAPGIFSDIAQCYRTLHDPAFKKAFWSVGENKGLKLVGFTCVSPSDYATVKPIRTLADFNGLKLRVIGSPLETETLRRLGATGVAISLSEVLTALQQGTIDGNKAGVPVFVPFKYYTVAKYLLRPRESMITVGSFASKAWFDKLPAELQTIVMEESADADAKMLPWSIESVSRLYKIWVSEGGVLTDLAPDEQAELRRRLSTVGDDLLKNKPEVLKAYRVMKAVAERRRDG